MRGKNRTLYSCLTFHFWINITHDEYETIMVAQNWNEKKTFESKPDTSNWKNVPSQKIFFSFYFITKFICVFVLFLFVLYLFVLFPLVPRDCKRRKNMKTLKKKFRWLDRIQMESKRTFFSRLFFHRTQNLKVNCVSYLDKYCEKEQWKREYIET